MFSEDSRIDKFHPATLYIVAGANGLPSVDPVSMQLVFLVEMQKMRYIKIKTVKYTPFSSLPKLVIGGQTIYHPETIRRRLEQTSQLLDKRFTDKTRSRLLAYRHSYHFALCQVALANAWGMEENIATSVQHYSKNIFFLFKFFFARSLRKKMTSVMHNVLNEGGVEVTVEHKFNDAIWALQELTTLLQENNYLLGEYPSTTDVFICSYLAPALFLQYPNNRLHNLLQSYPGVVKYVKKFIKNYGHPLTEAEGLIMTNTATNIIENERASTILILTAGTLAFTTMVGYAIWNGIIYVRY